MMTKRQSSIAGGDATRTADHMKLVVATQVSKGRRCGDSQWTHDETFTSWCTAHIIFDLTFQSSNRVCRLVCRAEQRSSMAGDVVETDCDLTAEDLSPVNELSFSLQNLQCQDG